MKTRAYFLVASLSLVHVSSMAAPPECKEPKAPAGCFRLVPIEVCDQAPLFDAENGRITYPCGLRLAPREPSKIDLKAKPKVDATARSATSAKIKIAPQVRYVGSTIKDNGDGTSTINHGGSASETINTADKERTIREYKDRGIHIR